MRTPRRFRVRALLLSALLGALLAGGVLPGSASAHAVLLSVTPEEGARLTAPPASVDLVFNENVGLGERGVRLFDSSGTRLDLDGDEQVSGAVVSQPVPEDVSGWVVASYQVVSGDGHVIEGAWSFAVGLTDASENASTQAVADLVSDLSPDRSWPWLRALGNVLLMVGAGAVMATSLMGAGSLGVRRFGASALVAAGAANTSAALVDNAFTVSGRPGLALLGRSAVPLMTAACVLFARSRRWDAVAAVLAAAALTSFGLVGHGFTHGSPLVNWLLLGTHLVMASAWLGAAPAVLLAMRSSSPGVRLHEPAAPHDVHRRFSTVATVALPLVVASAGVLAWVLTGGSLKGSYGVVLVVKSAVVASCALVGLWARRRLDGDPTSLRRVFLYETVAVVVIAALSTQLSFVGPAGVDHSAHQHGSPTESVATGPIPTAVPSCEVTLGSVTVALSLDSVVHGENVVHLTALGGTLTDVEIRMTHAALSGGDLTARVPLLSPTHASGPLVVPFSGDWEVTVVDTVDRFTANRGVCSLTLT